MKLTTKTIIGTVSTLMVVGMITSLVNGSETYFVGRDSFKRPRAASASQNSANQYGQASVLFSDLDTDSTAVADEHKQIVVDELAATEPIEQKAEQVQNIRPVVKYVTRVAPCSENEHPKLINGKFAGCTNILGESVATEPAPTLKVLESQQNPIYAPVSCEEQGLYTYLGDDYGELLYGTCIPCAMNKFNVQSKTCDE